MINSLVEILNEIRPENDFVQSQDFINDGLLDSFDVINLVSIIEEKFNINIDGEEIIPENFQNLNTLNILLKRYIQ